MNNFTTRLTGHPTASNQSVKVWYKPSSDPKEVTVERITLLNHLQTEVSVDIIERDYPECYQHLLDQVLEDNATSVRRHT